MIKINLLPYREERKKELFMQQAVIAGTALLLTILIISFFWWSLKSDITKAENEITRLKSEIKKQEKTIKKIEEYKKKKQILTKKMEIINRLQNGKTGPVHILNDLSVSLPGRLWLTSLKQKGMSLNISGKALDNISISNYMVNLEKSLYFKNIDLKQIKTESKHGPKGIQLKDFVITCQTNYTNGQEKKKSQKKKKRK